MKRLSNILIRYQWWTGLFLFLLGIGLILWFGYQINLKSLQNELIIAEKEQSVNRKELQEHLSNKITSSLSVSLKNTEINLPIFSAKEILDLLTSINDLSRKSHWKLILIEPMPVINQAIFTVQPIHIQAKCQYFQWVQFLQELTNSPFLSSIKNVALEKEQQTIAVNLLIEFYFKKS